MTRAFAAAVVSSGLLTGLSATAAAEGHSVAAKAGVLGLGIEYAYSLNDRLGFRFGLNGSEFGFDAAESGIDYEFDFVWDSLSLAVDFHPLRGAFRVTGGVLQNDNRLEAFSRPSEDVTVGGMTYTPEEIGTLAGSVSFDDTATFVSLGWDWSRRRERFGVSLDLGIAKQGAPTVALAATGPIVTDPMFADDIAAEQMELTESLEDFDVLPFATLGLVFRF